MPISVPEVICSALVICGLVVAAAVVAALIKTDSTETEK